MGQEDYTMGNYLEHANIAVTDVDKTIQFFRAAMPDFQVRHDSGRGSGRWVHLGTDVTYIAINQMAGPAEGWHRGRGHGAGIERDAHVHERTRPVDHDGSIELAEQAEPSRAV